MFAFQKNMKKSLLVFIFLVSVPSLAENCITRKASPFQIVQLLENVYSSSFIKHEKVLLHYRTHTSKGKKYIFDNGIYCIIRPNGVGDASEFYIAKVDCTDYYTDNGVESFDIKFVRLWPWSACKLDYKRQMFGYHVTKVW